MTQTDRTAKISTRTAFGALVPLMLLALMLAGIVISVANDMYAFVKPDENIGVKIIAPLNDSELSKLLRESGVIENELIFTLYLRSKHKDGLVPSLTGEWTLNSNMSYREILSELF